MLKVSTLKGQIASCILFSLLVPVIIDWDGNGDTIIDGLNLLIQLVGLCVLFGLIKNGKGSEFKVTRIIIAVFLWIAFWLNWLILHWLKQDYGFDRFLPKAVLFASCNAMAIAMVVILSYVIGKWINGKIVKEEILLSTLKGQIALCILLSLPIPTMLAMGADFYTLIAKILNLFIPLVVFFVLFWTMKNGKGSEFKEVRTMIVMLLWCAFWIKSFFYGSFDELVRWISKVGGFDVLYAKVVLYASYNTIAIAMVVILSYVIGKWTND